METTKKYTEGSKMLTINILDPSVFYEQSTFLETFFRKKTMSRGSSKYFQYFSTNYFAKPQFLLTFANFLIALYREYDNWRRKKLVGNT